MPENELCQSPTTRRVGLIGDPVEHSISPAMHQAAFDALGIPATYEAWLTSLVALPDRIGDLRSADVLGANVTVPHKQAVIPMLDDISAVARRAGAVNTIVNRAGRLAGDNTDIHGFATALAESFPDAASRPALLLGAGGAARAVVLALESTGQNRLLLANRDASRAEALAADLDLAWVTPLPLDGPAATEAFASTGLLINATSLGWHAGETPIPLDWLSMLPNEAIVVDLTYRDTDLLVGARARGLATLDGLAMLVHQGARAFELWTSVAAPVEIMMGAALQAREARS